MKRALTGAILIHAAAIVFAAGVIRDSSNTGLIAFSAYCVAALIGLLGFIALIAACFKSDGDLKS